MTALAANANRIEKDGKLISFPVAASTAIYKGALVRISAAGYLAPCASESGAVFAGVAFEKVNNSAGAAGALECRVEQYGTYEFAAAGIVAADLGKKVYAADDNLVQLATGTNLQLVGKIVKVISATLVVVAIDGLQTK
jgi:hypothetical protein